MTVTEFDIHYILLIYGVLLLLIKKTTTVNSKMKLCSMVATSSAHSPCLLTTSQRDAWRFLQINFVTRQQIQEPSHVLL